MSDPHPSLPAPPTEPVQVREPQPAPARPSAWKTWIVAGTAAAVLAVGGGIAISHSGGGKAAAVQTADTSSGQSSTQGGLGRRGQGTSGTIAVIDGATLTVTGADGGTTKVTTTDTTAVTKAETGALSDLVEGDHVTITGTTTGSTVAASRVVDNGDQELAGPGGGRRGGTPPAGGPSTGSDGASSSGAPGAPSDGGPGNGAARGGAPTSGTVASIDGSSFTVTTSAGETLTVSTTSDTTVTVNKQITVGDLAEGDTVRVIGDTTDGTVAATSIRTGEIESGPGGGFGGPPPGGGAAPSSGAPSGSGSTPVTPTTGA